MHTLSSILTGTPSTTDDAPHEVPRRQNEVPIEEHGLIGNMKTLATVDTTGCVDFFCFPKFDSPSLFCGLLDHDKGGFWKIHPPSKDIRNVKQIYWPDTNVLITKFFTDDGVAEVKDFMPLHPKWDKRKNMNCIVRHVIVTSGNAIRFKMEFLPAYDFGRKKHEVSFQANGKRVNFRTEGDDPFTFHLTSDNIDFTTKDLGKGCTKVLSDGIVKDFELTCGESAMFILNGEGEGCRYVDPKELLKIYSKTLQYWRNWVRSCTYNGRWLEMVKRSALTLKLLTYEETGAIIAAGTTSLPERIGGELNWDYRFVWIRDASFTLYALLRLGFTYEAEKFMHFLEKIIAKGTIEGECKTGPLQVMYTIDGSLELPESELDHLEGYMASKPVRIGNEAYTQVQLDIYGELIDSIYLYNKYGAPVSYDMWIHVRKMVDWVCDNWHRKDGGIWESRHAEGANVYSKLMCWVAVDRGIRLADRRSFPVSTRFKWVETRDKIFEEIMDKGWNKELETFTQSYGSDVLDASVLMMPLCFFLSSDDPRLISTVKAIHRPKKEGGLLQNSLVFRYTKDPLLADGEEGTFNICTFWLIEALTRIGTHYPASLEDSRSRLEDMFSYANHLGLFAEETSSTGRQLGNFPQAFTHIALISSAFNLDRALNHQQHSGNDKNKPPYPFTLYDARPKPEKEGKKE